MWSYADKECRDNGNYGVNIKYIGDTNVGISSSADSGIDLFSVDMVMDKLMQHISINSYYNGITVDKMYSDSTGDAFWLNLIHKVMYLYYIKDRLAKG